MALPETSPAAGFVNAANESYNLLASGAFGVNLVNAIPKTDENANMSDTPSRQEVDAKIAASAAETRAEFSALRADMAEFKTEVKTGFAEIRKEAHEMNANISRWMLQSIIAIIGTMVVGFGTLLWNISNRPTAPAPNQQPVIINVPSAAAPPPAAPASK